DAVPLSLEIYRTLFGCLGGRYRTAPNWFVALDGALADRPLQPLSKVSNRDQRAALSICWLTTPWNSFLEWPTGWNRGKFRLPLSHLYSSASETRFIVAPTSGRPASLERKRKNWPCRGCPAAPPRSKPAAAPGAAGRFCCGGAMPPARSWSTRCASVPPRFTWPRIIWNRPAGTAMP